MAWTQICTNRQTDRFLYTPLPPPVFAGCIIKTLMNYTWCIGSDFNLTQLVSTVKLPSRTSLSQSPQNGFKIDHRSEIITCILTYLPAVIFTQRFIIVNTNPISCLKFCLSCRINIQTLTNRLIMGIQFLLQMVRVRAFSNYCGFSQFQISQ